MLNFLSNLLKNLLIFLSFQQKKKKVYYILHKSLKTALCYKIGIKDKKRFLYVVSLYTIFVQDTLFYTSGVPTLLSFILLGSQPYPLLYFSGPNPTLFYTSRVPTLPSFILLRSQPYSLLYFSGPNPTLFYFSALADRKIRSVYHIMNSKIFGQFKYLIREYFKSLYFFLWREFCCILDKSSYVLIMLYIYIKLK